MKRIDIDPPFCGAAAPPVAAGRRVLLACVAGASPESATIQAIDVEDGRLAWTATLPSAPHTFDLATSLPLPRPDGGAWLAVHHFDQGVSVHGVDRDGRVDARINLPDEYPLSSAADMGSKMMLRLAGTLDGDVLCAWTYRQVREYGITRYAIDGTAIWSAPEWLLACDGNVTITCPVPAERSKSTSMFPPDRTKLMARDARNGKILWQLDVQDVTVAAFVHGTLYLVDRRAALDDARAQEAAIEARFLDGVITEDALKAVWADALPRVPMQVHAIDGGTGRKQWAFDAGAQVLGVVVGRAGVAVLCHELDGAIRLRCASLTGSPRSDVVLKTGDSSDPRRMPSDRAALMSAGDSVVVLTAERWLSVGFDGVVHTSGTIPTPCFGFEPRIADRWLTVPSAVIVDEHLVLRADRSVWIVPYGQRGA